MAISNHLVGAETTDFATDLAYGATFTEESQSADGSNGTVVYDVVGTVDNSTSGDYTVTYSAIDDDVAISEIVQTVTVLAATTNVDTAFDLGNEDRAGDSTVGTAYDAIVDAGGIPSAQASAYFDEGALDPYEVKHSK